VAFGSVGTATSSGAGSTTSGTTLAFSPTAQLDAGNLAVILVSCDNTSTTDGNTSEVTSVTDSKGNTWTKAREFCNGQGAAAGGAVTAIFFSKIGTTILVTDTITVTFANTIDSKSATAWEFTMGTGTVQVAAGSGADLADDNAAVGSLSTPTLASKEYLFVRSTASERRTLTYTATASHTTFTQGQADTGNNNTSMATNGEWIIATATSDTSSPSGTQSVDHASTMVALEEVAAGGGDVFFENRHPITEGMKPLTAAGMGGVLIG